MHQPTDRSTGLKCTAQIWQSLDSEAMILQLFLPMPWWTVFWTTLKVVENNKMTIHTAMNFKVRQTQESSAELSMKAAGTRKLFDSGSKRKKKTFHRN